MLIVVLLCAIVFYVVLYLLFAYLKTPIRTTEGWLRALDAMLFAPSDLVFLILRGVILAALFYVVIDLFASAVKRTRAQREQERKDAAEPFAVTRKNFDKDS